MIKEFKAFLTKSNALALAIGVIIGGASGKVVNALVEDIIMPLITMAIPGGDWKTAKIVLGSRVVDGKTVENGILYGHFLGTVIDFVVIAFVVFSIAKFVLKQDEVSVG
jgi:large conductance mechanosensitive channel